MNYKILEKCLIKWQYTKKEKKRETREMKVKKWNDGPKGYDMVKRSKHF